MFTEPDDVNADLVRQRGLFDHVTNDLRLRQQLAVGAGGYVAERVQSEFDLLYHWVSYSLGRALAKPRLDWHVGSRSNWLFFAAEPGIRRQSAAQPWRRNGEVNGKDNGGFGSCVCTTGSAGNGAGQNRQDRLHLDL